MKKDSIASICYPLNMEQMQKVKLSLSAKGKIRMDRETMKEIRNLIFDIGNVLVSFDPLNDLIRTYGEDHGHLGDFSHRRNQQFRLFSEEIQRNGV